MPRWRVVMPLVEIKNSRGKVAAIWKWGFRRRGKEGRRCEEVRYSTLYVKLNVFELPAC